SGARAGAGATARGVGSARRAGLRGGDALFLLPPRGGGSKNWASRQIVDCSRALTRRRGLKGGSRALSVHFVAGAMVAGALRDLLDLAAQPAAHRRAARI